LELPGTAQAELVVCDQTIDITYLPTEEGWLYLAAILDACSRRVVGWAIADHLRTELVLEALDMALRERRPGAGEVLHHRDRGCQYTASAYQRALAAQGLRCSMSRTGNCLDNAMAASFFATLKKELLPAAGWPTKSAARAAIFEWIAVYYTRQRLHSSLGYRTPVSFELSKGHAVAAWRELVYETGPGLTWRSSQNRSEDNARNRPAWTALVGCSWDHAGRA
jgi:putative transposase